MGNGVLARVDKDELDRVENVIDNASEEQFEPNMLLRSKEVTKIIGDGSSKTLISRMSTVPFVLPFYDNVFSYLCPNCVKNDDIKSKCEALIKRGLVIPILTGEYSEFPQDFAELVLNYPHINTYELFYLELLQKRKDGQLGVCPICAAKEIKLEKTMNELSEDKKKLLQGTFENFTAFTETDLKLLESVTKALVNNDEAEIKRYTTQASVKTDLTTASAINSKLQISISDLNNLGLGAPSPDITEFSDGEEFISKSLLLNYAKDLPFERYLDIFVEKRKRIANLSRSIINKAGGNCQESLSQIRNELEEINNEILEIQKSRRYELYQFLTNFVDVPVGFLARLILSGRCSDLSNSCSEKKYEGNLLDPVTEEVLSRYFGKKRTVIQTWLLRERLPKTTPSK
jgi:hypothetical protein